MSNLMRRAAEILDSQMRKHAREKVQYVRAGVSHELLAGLGQVAGDLLIGEDNSSLVDRKGEFVFTTSEMKSKGVYPPRPDDIIIRQDGKRFIVSAESSTFTSNLSSTSVYRDSDEFGISTRVHAVEVHPC